MAVSVVLVVVPALIVYVLLQKNISKDQIVGAVKGYVWRAGARRLLRPGHFARTFKRSQA